MNQEIELQKYYGWIKVITRSVLKRYSLELSQEEDYISAGYIGLIEASHRYNPEYGLSLRQYAFQRVRGGIIDAIRKNSHMSVRGYQHFKTLQLEKKSGQNESQIESTIPTPRDGGFGILGYRVDQNDEEKYLSSDSENPHKLYEQSETRSRLLKLLKSLTNDEKIIIFEHYFHEKSLAQIAREQGQSGRSWASRIHLKAIKKLREGNDKALSTRSKSSLPHSAECNGSSACVSEAAR